MSTTPLSERDEKDLRDSRAPTPPSLIITAEDEKRILRKLDLNVLPILSLLYLWSFLDRSNIGNAVLGGLKRDLNLSSTQLNIAISIFYASYVSWEAFSNIFLKKLRPSKYIPSLCLAWGLVTTLTCKVESFGGLVATRIFLGLTEAPLFPSICFIIGMWYPRSTTCFRFALFFCSASLAGAFGGLLARGLMTIEAPGIEHWRSIYLVEGLITMAVAVLAFFLLKDDFEVAGFLSAEDKEKLRQWHLKDRPDENLAFSWAEVRDALKMPLTWVNGIQAVGVGLPIFSSASFFPSIVAGLGYSNTQAQLMTVPPYAFSAVAVILTGYFSDRLKKRAIFLQLTCVAGIVGYAIQLGTLKSGPRYFGLFLVAYSVYGGNSITSQWYGNNLVGHSRRATAQGFSVAFGNLAAIGGSYIYPANQGPAYRMGHGIAMGCLALAFTTATFQWWWFSKKNQAIDRKAAEALARGETAPHSFRYMV